ncbi:hypothetical protein [Citricoccus sp. GCM10030269]|uniref:hypothetical protein n=1 Tax=Citricoccus sp. GCM10030269 TaxID=3273388 RepID=UPI0036090652
MTLFTTVDVSRHRPDSVCAAELRATERDLWSLAVGTAFAVVLLSPVRHYFGGHCGERQGGKDRKDQDRKDQDRKEQNRRKFAKDSFPLSTYPMFSEDRKDRVRVPHVAGFTAEGERIVPHYSHFGAGGLNQVRKQIARMVRQGRGAEIAQRYADSLAEQHGRHRRREADIVRVEVVRSRYVFDTYFGGNVVPQTETVHARAEVGGTAVAVSAIRSDVTQESELEGEQDVEQEAAR